MMVMRECVFVCSGGLV